MITRFRCKSLFLNSPKQVEDVSAPIVNIDVSVARAEGYCGTKISISNFLNTSSVSGSGFFSG
jgi:hypothetical protein